MPAKKGSIDGYNFKQKASDTARYIENNFWKVLPLGSSINYIKNGKKKNTAKGLLHDAYAAIGIIGLGTWLTGGVILGVWTPKQIRQYNEKVRIELELKAQEIGDIDYRYNRLFEEGDSLDIYKKYGLPIKFLEPSMEQKERAIKQSDLEKGLR